MTMCPENSHFLSETNASRSLSYLIRQKIANELGPMQCNLDGVAALNTMLTCVSVEHDLLVPRIDALEAQLPEKRLASRAFQESKLRPDWTFDISPEPTGSEQRALSENQARQHPVWDAAVPYTEHSSDALERAISHPHALLVVGEAAPNGTLETRLTHRTAGQDIFVNCGAGTPALSNTPNRPQYRPEAQSFEDWMALAGETDRAAISAYCLSISANRRDLELLYGRLFPGQVILAEQGSTAASWLDFEWRGTIHRCNDINIYAEPCHQFRRPDQTLIDDEDWPKISVVTVSYNQAKFLEECILSVLQQGYPNLEYIVIDACSTDGSRDILEKYRPQINALVIEPDEGQSDGLNKGFSLATGEILTWINSDDALAPLALRRAALAFKSSGADIVAGTCERIGEKSSDLLHRHYSNLPTTAKLRMQPTNVVDWSNCWEKGDFFFQPEVLFSRDIWVRSGGAIKRHLHWAMDWDLWVRMALAGATVYRIPDVIGVSRVQESQKTQSDEAYLPQIQGLLDEYHQMLETLRETVGRSADPDQPEE